jgi:DNA polymerase I
MTGVDIEDVDPEARALGKKCNFLLGYGGQWQLLASAGDMSDRAAKKAWAQWHRSYPAVKVWTDRTIDIAHQQGYVTTVYGRKRRLPQLKSFDESVRRRSERMGVNTVIQGSAADIMKLAMVQVYQAWEPWWDWKMTLTVHDELMHEVPENQVEAAVPLIRDAMENITKDGEPLLTVPLKAGIEVVKRWSDAK